jgi:hypothetical protein
MHDFDYSALAACRIASARRAEYETLLGGVGLCFLPFSGWKDAICFGHRFP